MTKNILLVEYDEVTINTIKELLPPPMFELAVANDGETARRKLADKQFDMMITAAMLPRFHGFNLALAVAQESPGIKIIIISAIYKGIYYKHQATTQYKADDFFEKPLEKVSFKKRILELLDVSENDLSAVVNAAADHVPAFDTAKIPTLAKLEAEEKKFTSDDIFGDLIKKIEKVPEFKIELNNGQGLKNDLAKKEVQPPTAPIQVMMQKEPPPRPAPIRTETEKEQPRQPVSVRTDSMKTEPPPVKDMQKLDGGKTRIPVFNSDLDKLRQQFKTEMPESKMKKIEDDIAKKFEDTLSGLGFQRRFTGGAKTEEKPAIKPDLKLEPKPVPPVPEKIVKIEETNKSFMEKPVEDEIVELGEEALKENRQPEPLAEIKKITENKESKPEKKIMAEDNPNELGDYVLLGLIARGGMAEIYKAKKKGVKGFEKIIAIKKILSGYGEDDKYIEMLVDEAKIAAELSHPNIIQIYDLGRKDNYYFIAMEYVLGKDLREIQGRLRENDQWFPEEISLFLCIKILEALNYAHKAKDSHGRALEIVHRDVSPPNILISYNGDVKLTDFGISKASIKMHQTISGALKGKLLYMSPEQARGEGTIDCRSDLFSVGVVLFELLTNKKLFLDTSEMGVLKKVQNGEIINPREINPDIDVALEKIILKSLNKTCDKRYQSAAAMIADLEAFIVKKYNYMPGPVQMSHFIYHLFEKEIIRNGIKVDLKPLPQGKPLLRDIPKVQPEAPKPAEPPKPVENIPARENKVIQPVIPPIRQIPLPEQPLSLEAEMHIDFDEDKVVPSEKKMPAASRAINKTAPLFTGISEEKSKKPTVAIVIVLSVMVAVAMIYFFVLKKSDAGVTQIAVKPAVEEKTATQTPIVREQPPAVDPLVLAAEKLRQEEELKKQQLAAEENKKLQEAKRARQVEVERLKAEEEARLKQEDLDRLQKEAEDRKKQEEAERLQKEALELKKAEELKEIERNRVKEGDIVPINDVDKAPAVVSRVDPIIPSGIRANMVDSQNVMFNILINQNGDVESSRLLQKTNNVQLNNILIATINTWKFTPAVKNGVRVKVWKTFPLIIKK